jgi:hypothetical protein
VKRKTIYLKNNLYIFENKLYPFLISLVLGNYSSTAQTSKSSSISVSLFSSMIRPALVANCNVRGRGSLSHYLVYSESPSRWCSLAIILLIYLHHNLLLVSNRSIQNTYRLVTLAVLTLLSLSCSLERFAFEYHVNISKTRYP